jgi:hypothetical protein
MQDFSICSKSPDQAVETVKNLQFDTKKHRKHMGHLYFCSTETLKDDEKLTLIGVDYFLCLITWNVTKPLNLCSTESTWNF